MQEDFWNVDWDKEFAEELQEEELELFDRLAKEIVTRQMTVPALMIIETFKPLNWVGSQLMLLLEPIAVYIFSVKQFQVLRRAFQKRESMEVFATKIEEAEKKIGPGKKKNRRSPDG